MDHVVLPLKDLPRTQALSSSTFKAPPLDGSLTVAEIYDWHLQNTPAHPVFIYADDSGQNHTIFWPEVVRAVHAVGRLVRTCVSPDIDVSVPPQSSSVVAILSAADTITYYTTMIGIVRAGHVAFPISPRNSPIAVAHLVKTANVKHLIVGQEKTFQALVEASMAHLTETDNKPQIHPMPKYEDIYLPNSEKDFLPLSWKKPEWCEPSIILHSSGSTAFPKPISWSHYQTLHIAIFPWFGGRDLTGYRLSCHAIPMFHGMGMMLTKWTCSTGLILTCFDPRSSASTPNPSMVLKGVANTEAKIAFSPPAFIERWSREPESVAILQTLDGVMFGGGPLDQGVGDALTAKGVKLLSSYGSTEVGCINKVFPTDVDNDWNYYEVSAVVDADYIPDGNGNFELVIKPGPFMLPSAFNTTINGTPAYATGDLLTPHPTKTNFWKIYGRADDQIMHSTGEKTNPGPLENILNQDPRIQSSVMFGRSKFNAGVLVDPAPAFKFDPDDVGELAEFRQKIWPTVGRMNDHAPQHSRIFKEMILVSKPSKPFTYTAKLTARRQVILKDYMSEIEELYESVDQSTQPDFIPPVVWTMPHTLEFVRAVVHTVLIKTPSDNDDIFHHGCDSLQATWIRNTILNALRKTSGLDVRKLPINFVYDSPSISALAKFISRSTPASLAESEEEKTLVKVKEMVEMANKYSENFPEHSYAEVPKTSNRVVLLTGSTGGLGSALLVNLLESPDVSCVYALNRRTAIDVMSRQKEAFALRAYGSELLASQKLILLDGDLAAVGLGLLKSTFEEITSSVTHIIHNAYTVNFNLALSSFDPNVAGLRNLIDLALSSRRANPPRFVFTSSIGVVRNYPVDGPVDESCVEASAAVGSGYSESKWVCEQVLSSAADKTGLKPIVVRFGQISGSSVNGYWNPKEWAPTLFRLSAEVGCLPNVRGTVSWIPVEAAAASLIEMCDAPKRVLHLAHPKPVSWLSVVKPISEALRIPVVPYEEWLSKVENSKDDGTGKSTGNSKPARALELQEFFRSFSSPSVNSGENDAGDSPAGEAMGLKQLDLREAVKLSPSLSNCAPLDFSESKKWLLSWGLM